MAHPFYLYRCIRAHLLAVAAVAGLVLGLPVASALIVPAQAQGISLTVEFHDALEPYGHWRRHSRWGEVWISDRPHGWRPYRNGHWVYTDEWGWYWVADRDEENWGWVAYHYGRWVFDSDEGWVWIPGNEWAPAWVDWRRGRDYVGWSPLPPDDYLVEARGNPAFWLFVRLSNLVAPALAGVYLPSRQTNIYIQNTVIVNRTVVVQSSGRTFAVNPGIQPAYIAAARRRSLPTYQVQPRVLAGTQGIKGAVTVSAKDIRASRIAKPGAGTRGTAVTPFRETVVQQKAASIKPAAKVPPPEALSRSQQGRLGARPPRAAQGAKVIEPTAPAAKPAIAPSAPAGAPGVKPSVPTPSPNKAAPPPARSTPAARPTSPPAARPAPHPAASCPVNATACCPANATTGCTTSSAACCARATLPKLPPAARPTSPPAARPAPPPGARPTSPPASRPAPPPAARPAPPPAARPTPPPAARPAPPAAGKPNAPSKRGQPPEEKK